MMQVQEGAKTQTLNPMVTGTSVIGLTFDGGVIIAADSLGSYGSIAKLRNIQRIFKVNDTTVIGGNGDYADLQFLHQIIEARVNQDECLNDGYVYKPASLYSWCTRVLYNRRSKFDPLWNRLVIAGLQDGQPFLGTVDMLGNSYTGPCIASGYGNYLAIPLMRDYIKKYGDKMTEAQARDVIERCLKTLYYRDGRAYDLYSIAVVTKDGVKIEDNKKLQTNWNIAHAVKGYD